MKVNSTRWASPILNDDANSLLEELYEEKAQPLTHALSWSPYEITVVSILLAYLNMLKRR